MLQFIRLVPVLREGATVAESEYIRPEPLPVGPCPASVVSVDQDGSAAFCCSPGATGPFFSLGNAHSEGLRDLRDRFHLGGKPQVLRKHGPAYFAQKVREQGLGHRLRPSYSDVCELCTHIAHNPAMARVAEQAARDFEIAQLRHILEAATNSS